MDKIESLRVFVAVADAGSFVAASRKLDVTPPTATRAIGRLEKDLGIRLFNRTTRRVRLTEAGQRYLGEVKLVLEQLEHADATIAGARIEPRGTLSVTAPVLFGQRYVVPIVHEYLARYPAVSVSAVFFDRIGNLIDEGLDVAVRIGPLPDSNLYAMRVGSIRRVVCASSAYLAARGVPAEPSELRSHSIVQSTTVEPSTNWMFGREKTVRISLSPRLKCNQNSAAIRAAELGGGLTRVMSYQIGEEVRTGKLEIVLAEYEPAPLPVHLVFVEGRNAEAKIQSFVELASARLQADLA